MFELIHEPFSGVRVFRPPIFADARGEFTKTYHKGLWEAMGLAFSLEEEFYSVSKQGVIRGMHFQAPPYAHNKVVYCVSGAVLDVLLDIRKSSPTYGRCAAFVLTSGRGILEPNRPKRAYHTGEAAVVYIPKGIAHGFMALTDDSCMVYKTDSLYAAEHDTGVRWDTIGFEWPIHGPPVISDRDVAFESLQDLQSPFP